MHDHRNRETDSPPACPGQRAVDRHHLDWRSRQDDYCRAAVHHRTARTLHQRLVLCQFLILGWPYTKTLVLLDGITMATLIFKIDRALVLHPAMALPVWRGRVPSG